MKLYQYGIRGIGLDLFKSYLLHRHQFVYIASVKSNYQEIKCGVPQGSILGPLLFILYINDLPSVSTILKSILFADDTSIFLSHQNIQSLQDIFNREIKLISTWFSVNKMCRTGEYACDTCSTHFYIIAGKGFSFVYLRNCIFYVHAA